MSSTPAPAPHRTGRALSRDEFEAHARDQMATAATLQHAHRHQGGLGCSCGRPWPCPQRDSLDATVAHFRARLDALAGDTVVLPVITAPAAPAGGLRRLWAAVRNR